MADLIFDSNKISGGNVKPQDYQPSLSRKLSIEIGQRAWTLNFSALPAFDQSTNRNQPYLVGLSGIVGSLLLFALSLVLFNTASLARNQAERITASLRDSEERFRLISENAADLIAIVDDKGQRLYNSPSYQTILGYSTTDLKRTSAYEQIHSDDRARVIAAAQDTVRTGIGHTLEYRMRRQPDGAWRDMESSAAAVRAPNGKVSQIVIVARDISERKRAEEALRQQTDFLSALYDTTLALMNRRETTDVLRSIVTRAAQLAHTAHGYLFQLDPHNATMTLQVGIGFFANRVGDRIKPGESIAGLAWQKGLPQAVDNYGSWTGRVPHPIFDQLKTLVGVPLQIGADIIGVIGAGHLETNHVFTNTDIERLSQFAQLAALALDNARLFGAAQQAQTNLERRVQERTTELRESEEKYRLTLESIEDGIYEIDLAGHLTFVNDATCRTFGFSKTQALGLNTRDYMAPGDAARTLEAFNQVHRTGEPLQGFAFQIIRPDGARRSVETSISLKRDAQGQPVGFRGVARDVTERQQAEALLVGQTRILEAIAKDAPQDELLTHIIQFAEAYTERALCAVTLLNRAGTALRSGVGPSLPAGFIQALDGIAIGPRCGSCGTAAYRAEQVITTDIVSDPLWVDYSDWIISNYSLRACWSTPIISTQGKVLGTFAMYFREARAPMPRDMQLMTMAAQLTGIVLERAQAAEALRLRNSAIEFSVDSITISDAQQPDFPLVYVNSAFENTTGYTAAEALGRNCRFLQGADREQPALLELRAAQRAGHGCTVILRNYRKDGTFFWNELKLSPVFNAHGIVTHFIGVQNDITARKAAEEALRQQASYQEALSTIMLGLVSHRDVDTLLSEILLRAGDLVGAPHGYLYLLESDGQWMQMRVGTGVQRELKGNRIQRGDGLAGRVWERNAPLVVNDYINWTGRLSLAGPALQAVVGVPLTRAAADGQTVVGVLGLAHIEVGKTFDQNTVAVITRFAQLASVALDNARLFTQTQQRIEELATINSVNEVLSSQTDLRSLLTAVTRTMRRHLNVSECYIALYDVRTDLFEIPIADNGNEQRSVPPTPLGRGFTAEIIRTRKPLLIEREVAQKAAELGAPSFTNTPSSQCYAGVPIFARDEIIGVIAAQDDERENAFDERAMQLLTTITPALGVAIQNAQLFEQTQIALGRTQKQAQREQLLSAITDRLHKAPDVQSVVRIAAEELQRATGSKRTVVRLGLGNGKEDQHE